MIRRRLCDVAAGAVIGLLIGGKWFGKYADDPVLLITAALLILGIELAREKRQ